MNTLLLCEDDPEKPFASLGIAKSVLDHVRAAGHTVVSADVEPHGLRATVTREMAETMDAPRGTARAGSWHTR